MEKPEIVPGNTESIEKLKPKGIIAGMPGIGKSTLVEKNTSQFTMLDLDSNQFRKDSPTTWLHDYLDSIEENTKTVDLLLISSHPEVVRQLIARGYEVTVVCADEGQEDEYREIYKSRNNKPEMVERFITSAFRSNSEQLEEFAGANVVFLKSRQNLSTLIDFEYQKRNLEQDRREFIKAIDSTFIEEIPTVFDEEADRRLVASLDETKLFLLGEMHGVKENVDIIYTLFKKFGFRQLALEWDASLKVVAEQYLETGEVDFDAIQNSPDGRITAGHFALLKKLKEEGLLDELVCFDGSGEADWNARDENMAKNILGHLSDSPTLAVAGNIHAKVAPITFSDEASAHYPMGSLVKAHIPMVPTGNIEYLSGQYHNYGTQDFVEDLEQEKTDAKFYVAEDGLYTFMLPEAHAAMVPNPSEKL